MFSIIWATYADLPYNNGSYAIWGVWSWPIGVVGHFAQFRYRAANKPLQEADSLFSRLPLGAQHYILGEA
jgi:hypothetical protein